MTSPHHGTIKRKLSDHLSPSRKFIKMKFFSKKKLNYFGPWVSDGVVYFPKGSKIEHLLNGKLFKNQHRPQLSSLSSYFQNPVQCLKHHEWLNKHLRKERWGQKEEKMHTLIDSVMYHVISGILVFWIWRCTYSNHLFSEQNHHCHRHHHYVTLQRIIFSWKNNIICY